METKRPTLGRGRPLCSVWGGRSGHLTLKFLSKYSLGSDTYLLVYDFTVFEYEECRDATDAVFGRSLRVAVYVEFTHYCFAFKVASEFFHYRTYHFTRSAPFCPKVYEDGLIATDYFFKVRIGDFNCFITHEYKILISVFYFRIYQLTQI